MLFGMGEKVGFTNCVLESSVLLKTQCLPCFQQNTAIAAKKIGKQNIYENCGLLWAWQEDVLFCLGVLSHFWFLVVIVWCLLIRAFWDFNGFVVCLGVFDKVANVFKCFVFRSQSFFGFRGVFYSSLFGLGRFRVTLPFFVFLVCIFFC